MELSADLIGRIRRVISLPGGERLAALLIGRAIPYSGTIQPLIQSVGDGRAEVVMRDRRRVRNHLRSIHAIALANLGEFTANLAMVSRQPPRTRWIVTGMAIDFVKKARGRLTAIAVAPAIDWVTDGQSLIETVIRDPSGDVVARVRTTIKSGPAKA
jgi:acyl-coenzyme A thioesterase PaaI-like protein